MKFRTIYTFLALGFGAFLFYSSSAGPGLSQGADRTGSPVASGFCGNTACHAAGAFSAEMTVRVMDDGMNVVTNYEPGKTYTVSVEIADDGNASVYGFQAVALDATDNSIGDFGTAPSGQQIVDVGGRDYIEQNAPQSNGTFEFDWTAPTTGTGDVTIYAAGIAGNGAEGAGGDGSAMANATLTEMVSSIFQVEALAVDLKIAPNPVQNVLYLSMDSEVTGLFDLNIFDIKGQLVQQETISLSVHQQTQNIEVSDLPIGSYLLQLTDGTKMVTQKMIKQ